MQIPDILTFYKYGKGTYQKDNQKKCFARNHTKNNMKLYLTFSEDNFDTFIGLNKKSKDCRYTNYYLFNLIKHISDILKIKIFLRVIGIKHSVMIKF